MHPDRLLPHPKVFGDALEGLPFVFVLSDDKLLEFSQLAVNRGLDFPEQSLPFRRVTSFVLDLPSVDADLPGEPLRLAELVDLQVPARPREQPDRLPDASDLVLSTPQPTEGIL